MDLFDGGPRPEVISRADVRSVADVVRFWIAVRGGRFRPTTLRTIRSILRNHVVPRWGSLPADELTPSAFEAALGELPAGTASKLHWHLRAAYKLAVRDEIVVRNPTDGVPVPKVGHRIDYLTADEQVIHWDGLFNIIEKGHRPEGPRCVGFISVTGCRKSEAMGLAWSEVDRAGRRVRLTNSKTGPRSVPLPRIALELLEAQRERWSGVETPYVFPSRTNPHRPITCLKHTLQLLHQETGLDKSLHVLRHTWATTALRAGVELTRIMRQLGHTRYQTTLRYAHLGDHEADATADLVADVLSGKRGVA